jgi:hypothetical protein
MRLEGVRELVTHLRPVLEGVAVARHEVTVVSVDVGERSKAVVLHLEEPIGMVEGFREPQGAASGGVPQGVFGRTRSGFVLGAGTLKSYRHQTAQSNLGRRITRTAKWPA